MAERTRLNPSALTARKTARLTQLRSATGLSVARIWNAMPNHGEDHQDDFTAKASPVVKAGQDRAISLSVAFLAALTGISPRTDRAGILASAAVDLTSPFKAFGHALNADQSIDDALAVGASTARSIGEDAVQYAARSAGSAFDHSDQVTGWQRIPDDGACDWCVEVAAQAYATADSASFGHSSCSCSVEPLLAGEEVG